MMARSPMFWSLLAVLACAPAAKTSRETEAVSAAAAETTRVSGRIVNARGQPVADGRLMMWGRTAFHTIDKDSIMKADADGRFEVSLSGHGAQDILFIAPGHQATSTTVHADGSDVVLSVTLVPEVEGLPDHSSQVAYLAGSSTTKRLAALQSGPLCSDGVFACPRLPEIRDMVDAALADEDEAAVRMRLLMRYLSARDSLAQAHPNDAAYARELLATLEPTSWRWSEDVSALVVASRATGERAYLERAFAEHPDPDLPALVAMRLQEIAKAEHDAEALARAQAMLSQPRIMSSTAFELLMKDWARAEQGPQPGDVLAGFDAQTFAGQRIGQPQLPGRLTLLHFWATWCRPCKQDMPMLHEIASAYGERGLAIVSFAADASTREVQDFRAGEFPMPWEHVLITPSNTRASLGAAFDLGVYPTWYLVDEEGRVLVSSRHPADASKDEQHAQLREAIEQRL